MSRSFRNMSKNLRIMVTLLDDSTSMSTICRAIVPFTTLPAGPGGGRSERSEVREVRGQKGQKGQRSEMSERSEKSERSEVRDVREVREVRGQRGQRCQRGQKGQRGQRGQRGQTPTPPPPSMGLGAPWTALWVAPSSRDSSITTMSFCRSSSSFSSPIWLESWGGG